MSQETHLLLASLLGDREVIAYRPALARALGSPLAALYLCQAAYWQGVAGGGEWWYKLRDADRDSDGIMLPPSSRGRQSWEWELGMSRAEQEHARRLLKSHGLLEERRAGVPARLYYRINLACLERFLSGGRQLAESRRLDGGIPPSGRRDSTSKLDDIQPAISETTTRNQPEITTTTAPAARGRGSAINRLEDLIVEPAIARISASLLEILAREGVEDLALAQDLIDELSGAVEAGVRGERPPVGSPNAWLRQLIARHAAGEFDRLYCVTVQARRHEMASAVLAKANADQSQTTPERARENLAQVRALISRNTRRNNVEQR